jgi:CheY-like chemotaxis protein
MILGVFRVNTHHKMFSILVIDDERNFREALTENLISEGYDVKQAHSADAAVELLTMHTFDMIILDLILCKISVSNIDLALANMPYGKQGTNVLAFLKQAGIETPVLAISNKASDEITEMLAQYPQCSFSFKSRLTNRAYIQKTIEYALLTRLKESDANNSSPLYLLRGIPKKLHYIIRQYFISFETYLHNFKGIPKIRIEIIQEDTNDDMGIRFYPPMNSQRIFYMFKEFVLWLESSENVSPVPELPIAHEQLQNLTRQLRDELQYYSASIAGRYWDNSWESYVPAAQHLPYEGIIELNPIKITNSYKLKNSKQLGYRINTAYKVLEKTIYSNIQENRTIQTLDAIIDFCDLYQFKAIKHLCILQQANYTNAVNTKLGDADQFATSIAKINLTILNDLMPMLEDAMANFPASN